VGGFLLLFVEIGDYGHWRVERRVFALLNGTTLDSETFEINIAIPRLFIEF